MIIIFHNPIPTTPTQRREINYDWNAYNKVYMKGLLYSITLSLQPLHKEEVNYDWNAYNKVYMKGLLYSITLFLQPLHK